MRYMQIIASAVSLVCVATVSVGAKDEQPFSVSKQLPYYNGYHYLAVNSKTGDVLVAWINIESGNSKKVYTAFCKRKKNNKYTVRKAILVSNPNRIARKVDVAYNPVDNSFVVVWDLQEGKIMYPSNLFSQKLGSKGKKIGGATQLTPSGISYSSPAIHYAPPSPSLPPTAKGYYLIAYDFNPNTMESNKAGVYTTYLGADGKMTGWTPVLVSPGILSKPGGLPSISFPYKLHQTEDGGFVLTLRKGDETGRIAGFLKKIDQNGKGKKQVKLGDYIATDLRFVQLSKRICLASWYYFGGAYICDLDDEGCFNQLFRPNLKKIKQEFTPLVGRKALFNDLVKLEADPGGYQLSSDGQHLIGRSISSKGRLSADETKLFNHKGNLDGISSVCIPGTNRVFVAWVDKTGDNTAELKGFVFKAK